MILNTMMRKRRRRGGQRVYCLRRKKKKNGEHKQKQKKNISFRNKSTLFQDNRLCLTQQYIKEEY